MVMMHIHVNTKLHFSRFRTVCKRIVGQNTFFEENEITSGVVNGFTNDLEKVPWTSLAESLCSSLHRNGARHVCIRHGNL